MDKLLEIRNLTVELLSVRGIVFALSGVDLDVAPGEVHGLVGESGCGKSMTAKSILRLHDPKRSRMRGEILFEGQNLLEYSENQMQKLRGGEISMIFQDPMTSLNPLTSVGGQIADVYRAHTGAGKKEADKKALELLEKVGLSPADKRARQYPFELSGGMQQRVMIAMAIACNPRLLIADEPTTALDVTIQAQILELLKKLSADMGMSVLLITHNFGIVAENCDRVSVMYAGKAVETGDTGQLLKNARHPYSRALIKSIPDMENPKSRLETIPGAPPALFLPPESCMFASRCPYRFDRCDAEYPEYIDCGGGHRAACFMACELGGGDNG